MRANTKEGKEGLRAVQSKMERQVGWNHVVVGIVVFLATKYNK